MNDDKKYIYVILNCSDLVMSEGYLAYIFDEVKSDKKLRNFLLYNSHKGLSEEYPMLCFMPVERKLTGIKCLDKYKDNEVAIKIDTFENFLKIIKETI